MHTVWIWFESTLVHVSTNGCKTVHDLIEMVTRRHVGTFGLYQTEEITLHASVYSQPLEYNVRLVEVAKMLNSFKHPFVLRKKDIPQRMTQIALAA
jgi:hypothetical protein